MKLHNIWGYGQLFGFSGLDGRNRYYNDFVGTLTREKIGIRFELKEWIKVFIPVKGRVSFRAITGDMIDAKTAEGDVFITFASSDVLVGYAPVAPQIKGEKKLKYVKSFGVDIWYNTNDSMAMCTKEENGLVKFAIAHGVPAYTFAGKAAMDAIDADVEALKKARYDYFKNMPKCKNKRYERMYYKALSVNKVNVHSPEGQLTCRWTTPDRVPHRHMWLWDSVFHALAMVTYNQELAKDALRAVLVTAQESGFIPCMINPDNMTCETQPQVLAWGVWEVYKKTGDKAFLKECVAALDGYLTWDKNNRDNNGNGLLEWLCDPEYTNCKSGESGQDNSPRFEVDETADAMDFSTFQAHDADCLANIYEELGDAENATKWREYSAYVKSQINKLLWDEETGVYYDRLMDSDKLNKVLTPASFFPMFAGIPTKEQAAKMVKTLTDPNLLWTPLPLATVSKTHPMYGTDMWRGGVWFNINYFVIKGLMNYGYNELAEELKTKMLETAFKWYKKTGTIFEFYDPEDKVAPWACERKGKPSTPPDWRKHVHSIVDFHWSSCFSLLFIQNELY